MLAKGLDEHMVFRQSLTFAIQIC